MARYVICLYCKERFDREKEDCVKVTSNRYAHKKCCEQAEKNKSQIEKDKDALENYIKQLFNLKNLDAKITKQINKYIKEYNYSYSGIHKALVYFFEIKGNSIEKANGGIGIVPYVYQNAYQYYFSLWQAQQVNQNTNVENYIPKVVEIKIPPPERKIKRKKLFSFLDKEE